MALPTPRRRVLSARLRTENPIHGPHQTAPRARSSAHASTPARWNTCRCFSMPRRPRPSSNSSRTPAAAERTGCISPSEPADPRSGDDTLQVTVRDNGHGIADPAVLLSFGQSGWDEPLARRERPAGMGIACLARRGCTVSSRARNPVSSQPATGWRMTLEPDHFLGKDRRHRRARQDGARAERHVRDVRGHRIAEHPARRRGRRLALRPALGDVQRPGTHAARFPRRRPPHRALERPRPRRAQVPAAALPRTGPQLPRPHRERAPAARAGPGRGDLDRPRPGRGLPGAGTGASGPQGSGRERFSGTNTGPGPS